MAEIKLYDYTELVDDGWWGAYEQSFYIGTGNLTGEKIVALIEAVPEGEEIIVRINSCGGYVFDGFNIYNALKAHKGNIVVRIEGLAASIASIIAMAGDEVIICAAALLMVHKPSTCMWMFDNVDADLLMREATTLNKIQKVLNDVYRAKTGLSAEEIDVMINAETWLTPDEAILHGFANRKDALVVETVIAENTYRHTFKNANAQTRAYANSIFKIQNNMNTKEAVAANQKEAAENKTFLNGLKKLFGNVFKNEAEDVEPVNAESELKEGGSIYYTGTLAVGTEVFTDPEMSTHPAEGSHDLADGNTITVDGAGLVTEMSETVEAEAEDTEATNARIVELEAEVLDLQTQLNAATNQLKASNQVIAKIKNVKSTYDPKPAKTEIIKKDKPAAENGAVDLSPEARAERRKEREEIKNARNKK